MRYMLSTGISAAVLLLLCGNALAQGNRITVRGRIGTYVYSYEEQRPDTTSTRRALSYESIDLDALSLGLADLSLHCYLRTLNNPRDAINGPSTKVYNLYLEYDALSRRGRLRLGRQYLSSGVGLGKMDGARLDFDPLRGVTVTGFVGTREPEELSTKIDSWSSSNTWGGRVRVDRITGTRIGWSYNRRSRDGGIEADLVGIDARNRSIPRTDLYGRLDYDRVGRRVDLVVVQASSRLGERLSVTGEYDHQRPQVRSNSLLSVFRQDGYDQVRLRSNWKLSERVGLEGGYALVQYYQDRTHRLNAGVIIGKWSAGLFYRSGYGGKSLGGYGNLTFDPGDQLHIRLSADYRKYRTVEETTPLLEAFVTSAAIDYSGLEPLEVSLEAQEARNALLSGDFRLFLRANYRFRIGK
jgi:hypothetical protein